MKFIKLGIISFVVLFVIATSISMLLPSTIIVSRAINISAPSDSAYAYVSNFQNWKLWLHRSDSSTRVEVIQPNKIQFGNSTITFLSSTPERISSEWKVQNGTPMPSEINFISSGNSSVSTVQWSFTHRVKWYPWEKFASILSDKALGPFMQQSLDNLKRNIEQKN